MIPSHLALAKLCQDAYEQPPDIADEHDVAVAIIRKADNGDIIVAFRGTVPACLHDDLADLEMGPKAVLGYGLVHAGFWDAGTGIAQAVSEAIGDQPYHLTGHSLGGAIAIVVATRLAEFGKPPISLTTFGAPRVAMGEALESICEKLVATTIGQYRLASDPVAELPLNIVGFGHGWGHPSPLIQLGAQSILPNIDDHAIGHYVTALEGGAK